MNIVAFDLDDTLYAEMDYVLSGYRAVAAEIAATTGADARLLEETMMRFRPRGFEAVLEKIAALPGADAFTVDSMVKSYRYHVPDICLRPGAEDTLSALRDAGCRLVLITDGSPLHQGAKIKALGLDSFFDSDAIFISEETGGDKTTPIPWRLAEKRFGTPGCRFFYIGDNLSKDFHLPNLAGWTTVMLRDTDGRNVFPQIPDALPPEFRPQITIDKLQVLKNIIPPCQ